MPSTDLETLLVDIRNCTECEASLPHTPRPILEASESSRILIVGQAPGRRVHESGVAWDDPSGDRLRDWIGITKKDFYDKSKVALIPMGFCYPGTGCSGDLPPRKECCELWHEHLFSQLSEIKFSLLIGQYAQRHRLEDRRKSTLTETVRSWKDYTPRALPLPHPSPRNNRWIKQNPWFAEEVLPYLKNRIRRILH